LPNILHNGNDNQNIQTYVFALILNILTLMNDRGTPEVSNVTGESCLAVSTKAVIDFNDPYTHHTNIHSGCS